MNELNSPQLKWLSDDGVHDKLLDVFMEVKVLTGAILHKPGDDLVKQIEVLKLFIVSHPVFTGLTVNEVRHAFYLNNQGEYEEVYRHYNKELNAEFIGDVLQAYVRYKNRFYRAKGKEVKAIVAPKDQQPVPVTSESEYREMIQQHYCLYLDDKREWVFMPDRAYQLLRNYGAITITSREHWYHLVGKGMNKRAGYGRTSLIGKDGWEKENILKVRRVYEAWEQNGWLPMEEYRMVVHTLRKMLYFHFFETMKYFNIKDIFREVAIG